MEQVPCTDILQIMHDYTFLIVPTLCITCNLGKVNIESINASSSLPNKYACGVAAGVCLAMC